MAVALIERLDLDTIGTILYHTGRIGGHFVVMVVCPSVGTHAATAVLTEMKRSFPTSRLCSKI